MIEITKQLADELLAQINPQMPGGTPPDPNPGDPPDGWYYDRAGFLFRNEDPDGLWHNDVAIRTRKINFADFPSAIDFADAGQRPYRLHTNIIKFPKAMKFTGHLSNTATQHWAKIYLCDAVGNVHMYGSWNADGIMYDGTWSTPAYVVQVSDGMECPAFYQVKE